MFRFFESRLPPYPAAEPHLPPKAFLAFVWDGTRGLRGYVAAMAGLSAAIAIYEALLFAVLGVVVDWISTSASPGTLWAERKAALIGITALLLVSVVLVALQTSIKHQVLAINFPLRLRWNFHRLMLGQSMAFYADEFAGRITTKIMQTALAVRDMIFTTTDVVIGMGIYLVTILVLLAGFDARLLLPFAAWMVAYGLACWYFVPRLGQVGKAQADARSVMTGRITDAYTNIATVKLFSHTRRESEFARAAMDAFKLTGLCADAPGEPVRDRQPAAGGGHDSRCVRHGPVAMVGRRGGCGCRGGRHRDDAARIGPRALGDVGDDHPV